MKVNENLALGTIKVEIEVPLGLRQQFPTLKQLLRDVVDKSGIPRGELARKIGMPSGSRLTRALGDNPQEKLFFPSEALSLLIMTTNDRRPLYWLLDRCWITEEVRQQQASEKLNQILPVFIEVLQAAGLVPTAEEKNNDQCSE